MKARHLYWLGFVIIAGLFIFVEAPGLANQDVGDEWVYYYMSKQVTQGKLPYRDFFYAHPPLQLLLYILPIKISVLAVKLIPFLSILGTGLLVFLLPKKRLTGLIAAFLFFTSYSVMLEATYGIGVCEATLLIILGVSLLTKGRLFWAGLFLGLAGMMRTYALIPAIVIMGWVFLKDRKRLYETGLGFIIGYIVPFLVLLAAFKGEFFIQVFSYHLLKPRAASNVIEVFVDVVIRNLPLYISAALIFLTRKKKATAFFGTVAVVYLVFLLMLNKIFNYYFVMSAPFLAIVGGIALTTLLKKRCWKYIILVGVMMALWSTAADSLYLRKIDFSQFDDGITLAKELGNRAGPGDCIFGDDSTATMFTFHSGLEVCDSFIDTNQMRFLAGLASEEEVAIKISEGEYDWVILRPLQGIGSIPKVFSAAEESCETIRRLDDPLRGTFILYKC
ncbi:MAG: hypothetical protein KJ709_09525 [Nanoarchaeota archaeon]|nr:hypothetical protein [Nanoarchaeota archaeon]